MKRSKIIEAKKIAAIVALDQSSCYDIISHKILIEKMKHIGFDDKTIEMIKMYFKERKQFVEINTKNSETLIVGNRSVQQGSVLSTIFYTIFMLDLPMITHNVIHTNQTEEFKCNNIFMITFIDDVYAIIEGEKENIWKKIENYISRMEKYYTSNRLKINTDKTQILISTPDKSNADGNLNMKVNGSIEEKIINKIKILGVFFSDDCKFDINLTEGSNCLLTQLKRRSNALKRISYHFPIKFKIQLINALLYGKIRYNLAIWGNLSLTNKNKVNRIILSTVKYLTLNDHFGKDIDWIMKHYNLMNFFELFNTTCYKQTYSNLNNIDNNIIKNILIENRTVRNISDNKCGTIDNYMGWNQISQQSFEYRMKNDYNKINRDITLAPTKKTLKKYIDNFTLNKLKSIPKRKDNTYYMNNQEIDFTLIQRCLQTD